MFDWALNTPLLYYDSMNLYLWFWIPLNLNCTHSKHSCKGNFFSWDYVLSHKTSFLVTKRLQQNTRSFLNGHIKITVYLRKNDDLILFHFNMKRLNMLNCLHIKMMKISFEIIRHHCFVLATTRNLHTCVCFYVNIRLNKNKSLMLKNLKIVFEYWQK